MSLFKIEDFYFRGTNFVKEDGLTVAFWDSFLSSDLIGNAEFKTQQIRRFASLQKNKCLIIRHSTSYANLALFLENIDIKQVGACALILHSFEETVGPFIGLSLYFEECRVDIMACWSMYKDLRAEEMVNLLLKPLIESGLHKVCRVYNDKDFEESETLTIDNARKLLYQIQNFSKYSFEGMHSVDQYALTIESALKTHNS